MKQTSVVAAVLFSVLALTALAQNEPPVNTGEDYDILSSKIEFGDTVYGIRCKNGTKNCNYKWDALCKTGIAKNADHFGIAINLPAYSRDDNDRPIRMFVCK